MLCLPKPDILRPGCVSIVTLHWSRNSTFESRLIQLVWVTMIALSFSNIKPRPRELAKRIDRNSILILDVLLRPISLHDQPRYKLCKLQITQVIQHNQRAIIVIFVITKKDSIAI